MSKREDKMPRKMNSAPPVPEKKLPYWEWKKYYGKPAGAR